ncbi:MAG: hypothetical protein K6F60_09265 [Eubacterium sp.]|nr:hypothetical protein [Eubacterium sp.]
MSVIKILCPYCSKEIPSSSKRCLFCSGEINYKFATQKEQDHQLEKLVKNMTAAISEGQYVEYEMSWNPKENQYDIINKSTNDAFIIQITPSLYIKSDLKDYICKKTDGMYERDEYGFSPSRKGWYALIDFYTDKYRNNPDIIEWGKKLIYPDITGIYLDRECAISYSHDINGDTIENKINFIDYGYPEPNSQQLFGIGYVLGGLSNRRFSVWNRDEMWPDYQTHDIIVDFDIEEPKEPTKSW